MKIPILILSLLASVLSFMASPNAKADAGVIFNLNPLSRFMGSFGGDINCPTIPAHVPVILIHGNADSSLGWTTQSNHQPSFTEQLKDQGYTNCDIYAVSYLSISEQLQPSNNYHQLKKMKFLKDYIENVMKKTGQRHVDIVTHSLGVTLTLETLDQFNMFKLVRKFVAIAGAMRGLESCAKAGPVTLTVSTCAAVINKKDHEFGFWPDGLFGVANPPMGDLGFSNFPSKYPKTSFYAISAGLSDEVVCAGQQGNDSARCQKSSYFSSPCKGQDCNVKSQVLIGKAPLLGSGLRSLGGDIADGIGHMRARELSGAIVSEMLLTNCEGQQCCAKYKNSCVEKPEIPVIFQ